MNVISTNELQNLYASGRPFVLLEALPPRYYQDKHLPGAAQLDHVQTRELAGTLAPDPAQQVVVYCANEQCQNSHQAAKVMVSMGYQKVAVYAGGKAAWESAGLAFEQGQPS